MTLSERERWLAKLACVIAERDNMARLLAAESARVGEAEGGMRILAAVLDQASADLRKVTAERDALAAKLDRVGEYLTAWMTAVDHDHECPACVGGVIQAILDEDGGE